MRRLSPLLLLFAVSCSDADAPGTGERISLTAVELGSAYAESEAAAQKKYGNRRLRVTGIVTAVTADASDHAVVRMKGPDPLIDVHLTIADEDKTQAGAVQKGAELTLLCEGATEVLGSPTLDGCTFEAPPQEAGNSTAG